MPKVSIVIPVLNGSKYVDRIFAYVLEQEHKDREIIFIADSRSTDDTLSKIRDLRKKYNDIVVVEHAGGGLGYARNLGIDNATGDLIWFLDVDDHPLPNFLSTLVGVQQKHNADVVVSNFIMTKHADPVIKAKKKGIVVMNRYEAMAARGLDRMPITSWSMVIRTDVITKNKLRFIPDGYAEDIDFAYRLFSVSDVICYCEEPLYVYIQNPGSMCNSDNDNVRGMAEIENYRRLIEYMKDAEPSYYKKFRRNAVYTMLRSATRMDKKHYMAFVKDPRTLAEIDTELLEHIDAELVVVKLLPRSYRMVARAYMKLIFYREGKTF